MAIEKSILGKDGFERLYHKIPSFAITVQKDGTCTMKIVTYNWKDEASRIANQQSLNLEHCITGLPPEIMKIAYEMLKKYFPEYDEGNDILEKKNVNAGKIKAVSQSIDGKLLEKREVKDDPEKNN